MTRFAARCPSQLTGEALAGRPDLPMQPSLRLPPSLPALPAAPCRPCAAVRWRSSRPPAQWRRRRESLRTAGDSRPSRPIFQRGAGRPPCASRRRWPARGKHRAPAQRPLNLTEPQIHSFRLGAGPGASTPPQARATADARTFPLLF